MDLECICIGDELLDGRVREANAAFLGGMLSDFGGNLRRVEIVGDQIEGIVAALGRTTARTVVVGGGLGPTDDDRTRDAAARLTGRALELDAESLERLRRRFDERGVTFTPNNERQAKFPGGAEVLRSDVGTAPGFRIKHAERDFWFFPGVPREFAWFAERYVRPLLHERPDVAMRRLYFHGIGESALETRISEVAARAVEGGVELGYRAAYPIIELKLRGPAELVAKSAEGVLSHARSWLVGEDDEDLPARVGRLLRERGETVTTAESCTAGGIAALITETAGSSSWFQRGYVTYANEAKVDELGVSPEVLLRWGAVSAQTVTQMAAGARRRARSTYAVAVSGIAGPGGGSAEKPVGLVHFGLAAPEGVYHRVIRYRLPDRHTIRVGTAWSALAMLLWRLEDRLEEHTLQGPFAEDDVWAELGIEEV